MNDINTSSKPIRFGLIGAARIAQSAHIPGFAQAQGSSLYGIASRDVDKAKAWAKAYSIPRTYSSYEEMLADPEIDAVLISLVHTHHAKWTLHALEAGKHVLCEKPMAPHRSEVEAMCAAARKNNRLLMEGFHHRFSPQFDFVDRLLASGVIGELKIIRSELTYPIRDWNSDSRANPDLDAGVLLEAGCYCVDTILHFMGAAPEAVKACAGFHEPGHFDATLSGVLKFPKERLGLLHTSMELPFRALCELIGTKGRITMPELFDGSKVMVMRDGKEEVTEFPLINRFAAQLDHFSNCIRGLEQPRVSLEASLANIEVIEQLLQSAGVRR